MYYEFRYKKGVHRICNGTIKITKSLESGNYILGLCTWYLEARVVHTAWHWIRTMYEAITSMDIDKSKWRGKRRNMMEIWRSGVVF